MTRSTLASRATRHRLLFRAKAGSRPPSCPSRCSSGSAASGPPRWVHLSWLEISIPKRIVDGLVVRLDDDAQPAALRRDPQPVPKAPIRLAPAPVWGCQRAAHVDRIYVPAARLAHTCNA